MSPAARAGLVEAGIGWVDETGAAEVAIGTLVLSRSGRPDAARQRPPHWTPAVLAAAEALLTWVRAVSRR